MGAHDFKLSLQNAESRLNTMNLFLYLTIILLWGTTWIAMKNQVGVVPYDVSVIYRFATAAFILFFILLLKNARFRFSLKQHISMATLGILLFCTNFAFFYRAAAYITSGLLAIIFSTSVIMIMLNNTLFFKKKTTSRMIAGGTLGIMGLCLIFWPELESFSFNDATCIGILYGLVGTYSFSLANQASTYCTKLEIPLLSSTFFGMIYGATFLTIICLIRGVEFTFDPSLPYVVSLLHLAIPGSVIGFLTYLTLIKRIGPEKAVYATLFFPLVALTISTFYESFEWVWEDFAGFALILLGNFLVMAKAATLASFKRKFSFQGVTTPPISNTPAQ